ncbi:MAG: hypothetical protein OXJ55_16805 [Caldilineaceae bacterium]|nr:hypothetical protein [Caldilineaceae bacterium]
MGALFTLGRSDFLNFRRDSMLQFLIVYPFILGGILRWLLPWVQTGLMDNIGFDLSQYYLLIVSFFGLLVIPQLVGLLVGTLLLDEKDQDTLTALMVTPMPVRTYALYRALTPALISVLGILLVVPFINVLVLPVEKLLPLAVSAAPLGPMMALILATLAKNKVEGLAIMKGLGIFLLVPIAAWFVPEPWQWLLGISPTYWAAKGYWLGTAGQPYLWVAAVGFLYTCAIAAALLRRFQNGLYS